jgi:type IV pilus assembly protein PilM
MAKAPTSIVGVDLGRFALKSVLLQRKSGNRFVVTNYASHLLPGPLENGEQLSRELKTLLKEMGGTAKNCAVGISSPDALIRIIEQPETPTAILRDALRLNGMSLLNQDCKEFVLDCDEIPSSESAPAHEPGVPRRHRYLVGGIPRTQVNQISEVFDKSGQTVNALQIAPICIFNAFEFAQPEVFNEHAFFLVDIGHTSATMMIGVKRELVLIRQIDFGGRLLIETLMALSGEPRDSVLKALDQEDEVMVENTRMALMLLSREVAASIGFFEGRREDAISKIWISGGPAKSRTLLKVLGEELHMPCVAWNALEKCEVAITGSKRERFNEDAFDLNVACGAAAEVLTA